jgi:transcriptional regulator GlxA family with amidase domain
MVTSVLSIANVPTTACSPTCAFRVGFISPSHFTRTFRQVAGINPSSYRKRLASDTHVSKTIPDR